MTGVFYRPTASLVYLVLRGRLSLKLSNVVSLTFTPACQGECSRQQHATT